MTNPYSNNTLPAARITLSVTGRLRQLLIVTASVFLLSACDGGIFGTGDGEDPKLDLETVDGDQNSGFSGVNEPPNIEDYEINDLNVAPPDDDDVPFGNNTQTDVDNRTLVRIVNAITDSTDSLVMIDRQDTESPLVALPGLSYADVSTAYLPVDYSIAHDFDFIWAEAFRSGEYDKIAGLNPLLFSENTVSTIILRGSAAAGKDIEVIPLRNYAATGSSLSYLRVIHAAPAFAQIGAMDVHLKIEGELPDPTRPSFDMPLSYEKPDTGYLEVVPGNYTFTGTMVGDSTALVPETYAVELNPGQVLTFVIRDNLRRVVGEDVEIVVLQDSTLPDPAGTDDQGFRVTWPKPSDSRASH